MSARGMWDAAKHPRGAHGKFGRTVSINGAKPRAAREEHSKRVLPGHTLASAITGAFADRSSGHKRSVLAYEPGIYGGKDARLKYKYRTSIPGWELVGHEPRPAGSTLAALREQKARKSARGRFRR